MKIITNKDDGGWYSISAHSRKNHYVIRDKTLCGRNNTKKSLNNFYAQCEDCIVAYKTLKIVGSKVYWSSKQLNSKKEKGNVIRRINLDKRKRRRESIKSAEAAAIQTTDGWVTITCDGCKKLSGYWSAGKKNHDNDVCPHCKIMMVVAS